MDMLGHHHVSRDEQFILVAYPLQRMLEQCHRSSRTQLLLSPVTTEGDEVQVTGLLKAFESAGHGIKLKHRIRGNMSSTILFGVPESERRYKIKIKSVKLTV